MPRTQAANRAAKSRGRNGAKMVSQAARCHSPTMIGLAVSRGKSAPLTPVLTHERLPRSRKRREPRAA